MDGTPAHRFAEKLPRRVLLGPTHTCDECETTLGAHEGPQHARHYEREAKQIATVLKRLGEGGTYVHTADELRRVSPGKQWARGARKGGNGTLAADWVSAFGPVVTGPVTSRQQWPITVTFDDLPFNRKRTALAKGKSWVIRAAYVPDRMGRNGKLLRMEASSDFTAEATAEWLRSIPGRPLHVVLDGSSVWAKAVELAWPMVVDYDTGEVLETTPTVWPCTWHLTQNLISRLREDGWAPKRNRSDTPRGVYPVLDACRGVFTGPTGWDIAYELVTQNRCARAKAWFEENAHLRTSNIDRPLFVPRTIGGLEADLKKVRDMIGPRAAVLRNRVRLNRLLDLMTLDLRKEASLKDYSTRIRVALEANAGVAPPQRAGVMGYANHL